MDIRLTEEMASFILDAIGCHEEKFRDLEDSIAEFCNAVNHCMNEGVILSITPWKDW